jgi:Tfp pilus assembly protein FimT
MREMEKFKLNRRMSESGLSLVELLASIVILTLLLTTFLMMFLQSAKINKTSENIINATYIAQTEMENIYGVSVIEKYSERENAIVGLEFLKIDSSDGWITFEKKVKNTDRLIKVRFKNISGTMDRVIVDVYKMPNRVLQSKMENVLVWKENS